MLTRIEMLIGSWKVPWLDKHSSLLVPGGVPDEAEPKLNPLKGELL
jgi:hypothetical protein